MQISEFAKGGTIVVFICVPYPNPPYYVILDKLALPRLIIDKVISQGRGKIEVVDIPEELQEQVKQILMKNVNNIGGLNTKLDRYTLLDFAFKMLKKLGLLNGRS